MQSTNLPVHQVKNVRPTNGRPPISGYTEEDFAYGPFVAFYEVTRACDLLCKHCRACAMTQPHKTQLTNAQSKALIDQFATFPKPPVLVFTGGDPMKRPDIFELIEHAVSRGVTTAMTPSATPLMTHQAVRRLKEAGLSRLALSIDAADPETHDAFRQVPGSFDRTLDILHYAHDVGLPLQVNTTITTYNADQVDDMAALMASLNIELWSVFFLIPVGRGLREQRIPAWKDEQVFERLYQHARSQPYAIKTTEAHHYRRYVLEQMEGQASSRPSAGRELLLKPSRDRVQRAPLGVNDGRGVMFVSHTGMVYPSGFMPIACGTFPDRSIVDIYQNSSTFRGLRDKSRLKGKCGVCEYKGVCGGSRARAYALTGDPYAAEPDCVYIPKALRESELCLA
jgi:radical SAM protein